MKIQRFLKKYGLFWNFNLLFSFLIIWLFLPANGVLQAQEKPRLRKQNIGELPHELPESSGSVSFHGLIWTHNDSGGQAVLYGLDTAMVQIQRTIRLINGVNRDWESLAADSNFLYIGDIGNNSGARKDLCIYRVQKSLIPEDCIDCEVLTDSILFSYKNQSNFNQRSLDHSFDAEALVVAGDSLILFTKDWVEKHTVLYKIPKKPGKYEIDPIDTLKVRGLVTGAYYHVEDSTLFIIGYRMAIPFIYCFKINNISFQDIKSVKRKIFPLLIGAQAESILKRGDYLYLTTEKNIRKARLYKLRINR